MDATAAGTSSTCEGVEENGEGRCGLQEEMDAGESNVVEVLRDENEELKKRLQQELGMQQVYAKKMEEAEEEWLQQMEQLQSFVQAIRTSLYETAEASFLCSQDVGVETHGVVMSSKPTPVIMQSAPGGVINMDTRPRSSNSSKHKSAQRVVSDLKASFNTKTSVLADDMAFIHEVREGVCLAPEMDPETELQGLIRKFKIWKREFKDQLKAAADQIKKKNREQSSVKSRRGAEGHQGGPAGRVSDGEILSESDSTKKKVSLIKRWLRRSTQYT